VQQAREAGQSLPPIIYRIPYSAFRIPKIHLKAHVLFFTIR